MGRVGDEEWPTLDLARWAPAPTWWKVLLGPPTTPMTDPESIEEDGWAPRLELLVAALRGVPGLWIIWRDEQKWLAKITIKTAKIKSVFSSTKIGISRHKEHCN